MASSFSFDSNNPFFAPVAPAADARSNEEKYEMIPCGPALDASEVESSELAVEVVVKWSDNVLYTGHLSPVRAFTMGEEDCDIVVPAAVLGSARAELVSVDPSGVYVNVPAGAVATLKKALDIKTLAATETSQRIALENGARITIEQKGLSFEIAGVNAGKKIAGKLSDSDKKPFGLFAFSAALHGAIAAAMLMFVPALSSTEETGISQEQKYTLMRALQAQAEAEMAEQKAEQAEQAVENQQGGQTGKASAGESGAMGKDSAPVANKHYSVSGGGARMLSRQEAIQDAQDFGMAGMLASLEGSKNAPVADWGDIAMGPDAANFSGHMFGQDAGDAYGPGGLNLSGIGEGGGSKGWGVGVGTIATVGNGTGTCKGANCNGFGNHSGYLPGTHKTQDIKVRINPPSVSGRLPPDVIQRVVRQNFGRFRGCYEAGLRNNPNLQGRVAVAFVIGRDGAVGSAQNGGSDLPDSGVVSCVVRSFYGLSFPAPEDGTVRVTYPITFTSTN